MSDLIERLQDLYLYMREHYRQYPLASKERQTAIALKDAKRAIEAMDVEIERLHK